MAMKKKVTLYLNKEIYARAQEAAKQLPGASVSGMVDEALEAMLPAIEAVFAMKSEHKEIQQEQLSRLLAEQLLGLASEGVDTIRTVSKK